MQKVLLTLIASIVWINVATAATLTPKKGVSILYINGVQAEDKVGKNHLEKGYNQIVIRMDKDLSRGSSPAVFTSAPYVLSFEVSGEYIVIGHPQARSEMEAKKAFVDEQPQWFIEQDDSKLAYEQEKLQGNIGLFPYLGMDELVLQHNKERGIHFNNGELIGKPVKAETIVAFTTVTTTQGATTQQLKTAVETKNLEQLKAWYLKASKKERKEFRKWMIDQE